MSTPSRWAGLVIVSVAAAGVLALAVVRPQTHGLAAPGDLPGPSLAVLPIADLDLANRTVDQVRLFRAGHAGRDLTLHGPELSSILQHVAPGLVPPGVLRPTVSVAGGRIVVRARVVTAELPGSLRRGRVLPLGDTLDVRLVGTLIQSVSGALTYRVEEAKAGRIRLPMPAVHGVLEAMAPGASSDGVTIPAPADIGWVYVLDDRIVVRRYERILDREVDGGDGS